jgi:hypothetical protein
MDHRSHVASALHERVRIMGDELKQALAGTDVVFVHEIRTPLRRTARAFDRARVVRVIASHGAPHPDDQFEIEFHGERFVVSRRDIRHAADPFGAEGSDGRCGSAPAMSSTEK